MQQGGSVPLRYLYERLLCGPLADVRVHGPQEEGEAGALPSLHAGSSGNRERGPQRGEIAPRLPCLMIGTVDFLNLRRLLEMTKESKFHWVVNFVTWGPVCMLMERIENKVRRTRLGSHLQFPIPFLSIRPVRSIALLDASVNPIFDEVLLRCSMVGGGGSDWAPPAGC